MMMSLSVEMARYKITSNAVIPGWVETAMTERVFGWQKFVDAVIPRIPMRRWGTPAAFGAIAASTDARYASATVAGEIAIESWSRATRALRTRHTRFWTLGPASRPRGLMA